MKKKMKFIVVLAFIVVSFHLYAQQTIVPLCDKLEFVSAGMEKKLQLFTEYEDFQQAMLYKDGDNYILEIVYKDDEVFKIDRKAFTQVELDVFCEKINQSENLDKLLNLEQNGRTELLISSTVSGLAFYGLATPVALNIQNSRPAVATYMLVGGSSFFIPFLLTDDKKVTRSMARAYSIGTGTGIGHGLIIKNILSTSGKYTYSQEDRQIIIPIATGLAESVTFTLLTNKYNLSVPNVGMIGTGGVWGSAWGASVGDLFTSSTEDYKSETAKISLGALLGSGAGMYLGHQVYKKTPNMTNGDVIVTNTFGILGGLYAATAIDLAIDINTKSDEKIILGSMTAASIGGMVYGLKHIKGYHYSTSEGAYVGLSEIAGGLLGMGVGYLVDRDFNSETALISASIGATGGLFIIDNYIRNRSLKINTSVGNYDFGFNPMGVVSAFDKNADTAPKSLQYYQRSMNNYIIRASVKF